MASNKVSAQHSSFRTQCRVSCVSFTEACGSYRNRGHRTYLFTYHGICGCHPNFESSVQINCYEHIRWVRSVDLTYVWAWSNTINNWISGKSIGTDTNTAVLCTCICLLEQIPTVALKEHHNIFSPRPVLAFRYCHCLCLSVPPSMCQSRDCPRGNLSPVPSRLTKFGADVQNTLFLVFHWPSSSWSNLTSNSKFTLFWVCQCDYSPPI